MVSSRIDVFNEVVLNVEGEYMKIKSKYINWLVVCTAMLFYVGAVIAGAPSGHPRSVDREVGWRLEKAFSMEGYYYREFRDSKTTGRCISAYLWDNRRMLVTTDIPKHREVDLVICIMKRKGVDNFDRYFRSEIFSEWCDRNLR